MSCDSPVNPPVKSRPRRKIAYPMIVEAIRAYRDEARAKSPPEHDAMDRRRVMAHLTMEWDTGEAELERRGFDRAYRLIVEGL